jgi:hypothetical protein
MIKTAHLSKARRRSMMDGLTTAQRAKLEQQASRAGADPRSTISSGLLPKAPEELLYVVTDHATGGTAG